ADGEADAVECAKCAEVLGEVAYLVDRARVRNQLSTSDLQREVLFGLKPRRQALRDRVKAIRKDEHDGDEREAEDQMPINQKICRELFGADVDEQGAECSPNQCAAAPDGDPDQHLG